MTAPVNGGDLIVGCFEFVAHHALSRYCQHFYCYPRAGNITAQPFEFAPRYQFGNQEAFSILSLINSILLFLLALFRKEYKEIAMTLKWFAIFLL